MNDGLQLNLRICLTSLPQPGCDVGSIFKWNSAGLSPGCSFSKTGCFTTAKLPSLPKYLPITEEVEG